MFKATRKFRSNRNDQYQRSEGGDAAQTTASIGADYNITKAFSIDANWEYYDKLYAQFNPINFLTEADREKGIVKLPSYSYLM
jgi:hypothetical protein